MFEADHATDRRSSTHRNVTLILLCGSRPDRPAVRLLLYLESWRPIRGAFDVLLADAP